MRKTGALYVCVVCVYLMGNRNARSLFEMNLAPESALPLLLLLIPYRACAAARVGDGVRPPDGVDAHDARSRQHDLCRLLSGRAGQ